MALRMPVWDDWKMPRSVELPSERAERLVREAVGKLEPGAQLPPIKVWATELGTTRTTLSRVLKKLEAEGLVVIRSGWGSFVSEREHQD
jgi:DNA-binding FadR family transcriptional regulator